MRSRALVVSASLLALASCDDITDPVIQRGLRIENRTPDTLIVAAVGVTALTDIFVPPLSAISRRQLSDSTAFRSLGTQNGSSAVLIVPGESYTIRSENIADDGPARALIVLTSRVRRGYTFSANPLLFEPAQLRTSNANIHLRASQYFPDVAP